HTAGIDNLDNWELNQFYKQDFLHNAGKLGYANMSGADAVDIVVNAPRMGRLEGEAIRVQSLRELTDGRFQLTYLNRNNVRTVLELDQPQVSNMLGSLEGAVDRYNANPLLPE